MAEAIKIVFRSFSDGLADLGRGWDYSVNEPRPRRRRSVDYYFAKVGERLIRARRRFEDEYLGASNANV